MVVEFFAKNLFGILPDKKAFLPATIASAIALAINFGFCASATAVVNNTPSHANYIAIATSEAVPTPASIITGMLDCSTINFILF